jgi:hypothetical protein
VTDERETNWIPYINSMYRAGWPQPETFYAGDSRAVYERTIRSLVVEYKEAGKYDLLLKLGRLASEDLHKALYLAGYSDEP